MNTVKYRAVGGKKTMRVIVRQGRLYQADKRMRLYVAKADREMLQRGYCRAAKRFAVERPLLAPSMAAYVRQLRPWRGAAPNNRAARRRHLGATKP